MALNSARKCRASGTMSSVRSRSGGIWSGKTASRYSRSSRNWPSRTASMGSRLVAARMRTSLTSRVSPPTRWKLRLSSTRSNLICISTGISVTSSRNSVPP
ncbi:hypothetical protein D3C85_1658150 [compost metagenome]